MTAWPNPDKPGYPQNPERDGDHLITERIGGQRFTRAWHWDGAEYSRASTNKLAVLRMSPSEMVELAEEYLGPCHTPADLAAARAEGAEAMKKAAIRKLEEVATRHDELAAAKREFRRAVRIVSNIPIPAADALARRDAGIEDKAVDMIADHLEKCGLKAFWVRSVRRLKSARAVGEERQG